MLSRFLCAVSRLLVNSSRCAYCQIVEALLKRAVKQSVSLFRANFLTVYSFVLFNLSRYFPVHRVTIHYILSTELIKPNYNRLRFDPPSPLPYLPRGKAVSLCQSELSPINIMELDIKRKTQYVGTTQVH